MIDQHIRMLAAIMFTDMVGYSALMQVDEKTAKEKRDRHRKVLEDLIFIHQGKILQYYGDGTLTIFGSAIQAVICAVEIQRELQKEPKVPLRIGIHIGDIVWEDEGVYGDGVNIAARIEGFSVSGGILISDKVYDEIKNQTLLPAQSCGSYELKNIIRPVELFAITAEGIAVPELSEIEEKAGAIVKRSIAVLPFVNMSADPENEYFSDGITEEIINALTKIKGLRVTSRTSTFMFKRKNEDIRKIGHQLNVNTVLEGSVRKFKDRVRITAQLINTADGYHQWSEVYDRKVEDIFSIQDEISKSIARKLSQDMTECCKEPLVKTYTKDTEAYNLFLKGLFHWNKWTASDAHTAIKYFGEAAVKDPGFALPYSALANCYIFLGAYGFMTSKASYPKAKGYADKALQLDPNLAEAYTSKALVRLFFDWDWNGAYDAFKSALKLSPGSAIVHHCYTYYLQALGRMDEAVAEMETARILDPLSLVINNVLAEVYFYAGRLDDALEQINRTLELDPNFRGAIWNCGIMNLFKGNYQKAIDIYENLTKNYGDDPKSLSPLGLAYALSGNKEKAKECIQSLNELSKDNPGISLNLDYATIYRGLGEKDKMFCHLEKAVEEKVGGVIFLKSHPEWKKLSGDPRYSGLLKKIGLESKEQKLKLY